MEQQNRKATTRPPVPAPRVGTKAERDEWIESFAAGIAGRI